MLTTVLRTEITPINNVGRIILAHIGGFESISNHFGSRSQRLIVYLFLQRPVNNHNSSRVVAWVRVRVRVINSLREICTSQNLTAAPWHAVSCDNVIICAQPRRKGAINPVARAQPSEWKMNAAGHGFKIYFDIIVVLALYY